MLKGRKAEVKGLVESAISILVKYEQKCKSGELTQEDAQVKVPEMISCLCFRGDENHI